MVLSAPFCPLANLLNPDQSGRWLVGAVGVEFAVNSISPADSVALSPFVLPKMQLSDGVLWPRCGHFSRIGSMKQTPLFVKIAPRKRSGCETQRPLAKYHIHQRDTVYLPLLWLADRLPRRLAFYRRERSLPVLDPHLLLLQAAHLLQAGRSVSWHRLRKTCRGRSRRCGQDVRGGAELHERERLHRCGVGLPEDSNACSSGRGSTTQQVIQGVRRLPRGQQLSPTEGQGLGRPRARQRQRGESRDRRNEKGRRTASHYLRRDAPEVHLRIPCQGPCCQGRRPEAHSLEAYLNGANWGKILNPRPSGYEFKGAS
jgi:hypothetical protein